MKEITLGIDIGGTNTVFGAVDHNGKCYFEGRIPTQEFKSFTEFVAKLKFVFDQEVAKLDFQYKFLGIGVGAPNGNFYTGTLDMAPNLPWRGKVEVAKEFNAQFDLPVWVTNDAKAAAIGEMMFGSAKGMSNFLVVTLGTGLGSGFVVNGNLIYGHDGFAGEFGHVIVTPDGRDCGCGRKGCLETYVSATGIKRTVYKFIADSIQPSSLRALSFDQLSADMITKAADAGDPIAIHAFDYTGRILGSKLADMVNIFSPEAIILFGGLAKAGDYIFKPVQEQMEADLMPIFKNKVKILPSGIHGSNAAVLGAAALAWKELGFTVK